MTRVLSLVTEAYGGRGGIAQATRDVLDAFAEHAAIEHIDALVRLAPDPPTQKPGKVDQAPARTSRISFALKALTSARRNVGIVYCNHLYMAPLAKLVTRLSGARLIVHLHGIEAWGRMKPHWRRALEAADLVVCVSRYTRQRVLEQIHVAPERMVVVSNTVDERFHPGDRASARKKFGLTNEVVLLTVARLNGQERYKGHDKVLRLLSNLRSPSERPLRYLIAGDGDDRARLEKMARELGISGSVTFLGQVPHEDLPDLYRAADIFAMPSEGEGFGIAFLEAMISGTPAIGLAEGGAPDALGDGELGSCVHEDQFGDELKRVISLPEVDRVELAARVRERFGQHAFRRQVANALERLITPRSAPGTA